MKRRFLLLTLFCIVFTLVCWASAFVAIRAGLKSYSPVHLALLRFVIASLVLLALNIRQGFHLPQRRDFVALVGTGIIGITVYNVALNYGEQSVTASVASFLVNTGPVFTAILALAFLHERIRAWGWVGVGISFGGVTIIALSKETGPLHIAEGALLVLVAAFVQSVYFVVQKPLLTRYNPLHFTAYAIWSGTLGLLVFTPGLFAQIAVAPFDVTGAVIYLGVFPAALAYITWAYVLAHMPAAKATSFLYLVPLIATLIGWLWLNETPTEISLLGGAIALIGVIIVNTLGKQKIKLPQTSSSVRESEKT